MTDDQKIAQEELRQLIERIESVDEEIAQTRDARKEILSEAKSRGYDTKILLKVVALRKRHPDDIAEEEAILEMYKAAMGLI